MTDRIAEIDKIRSEFRKKYPELFNLDPVENWKRATKQLAEAFVTKYYGEKAVLCMFWIGGEIGDILCINDDFYKIDRMVQALESNATYEQLAEFSEYECECREKGKDKKINFKKFVKHGFELIDNEKE
jgi:hypothetical protein